MFAFRMVLACHVVEYLLIHLVHDVHFSKVAAHESHTSPELENQSHSKFWTDEQRLITGLVHNYDSASRPVFNASQTIVIRLNFKLIQINDMVC